MQTIYYGIGTNKDGKAVRIDIDATSRLQAEQEAAQTCKETNVSLDYVRAVQHTLKQGSTMPKGAKERFRRNRTMSF